MRQTLYAAFFKSILLTLLLAAGSYKGYTQCQTITVTMASSNPESNGAPDFIIRSCQNTPVTITANVNFADSVVPAKYIWSYGDDTELDTTNNLTMTHIYTEGGVYIVDLLVVTNNGGCTNTNRLGIPIQISTTPLFEGTRPLADTICLNSTAELHGEATPVPGIYDCAPPVADTTFLPDGSGVSYTTSIEVDCFAPGANLTDITQIESICLNMEHSYSGDLDWEIICPNGQEMVLKNGGGGGTILGFPVATDLPVDGSSATLLDPGIGLAYCFSPTSTNGFLTDNANWTNISPYTDPIGNVSATVSQANAGTYQAVGDWNNLVGCPLNGDWTIQVTDNLGADNGYIFSWGIEFDPSLLPGSYSFLPEFDYEGWVANADIIATTNGGHDITVKPTSGGQKCYTYQVVDNFNCTYDTTVCIWVVDAGDPGLDSTARLCLNEGTVNAFDYLSGTPDEGGIWSGTGVQPNGSFDPAMAGVGTHILTYSLSAWHCDTTAVVTFNVVNDVVMDFEFTYGLGCTSDTVHFNNLSEPGQYWWSFGDDTYPDDTTKSPTHIYEDQGQYPVRLTVQNLEGCIDSVTKMVDVAHPFVASFTQSIDSVCQSTLTPIQFTDASTGNITGWQWDFGDGDTSTMQNPTHTYTTAGVHQVRLIVNEPIPCYDTFYREIYVDSLPFIKLTQDKHAICVGDEVNYALDYLQPAVSMTWEFGDGVHWEGDGTTAHSYSNAGLYWTTVTTDYLICESMTTKDSVIVHSLPYIDLGPDTALCLDGQGIHLIDAFNSTIGGTSWQWSTGDTTNSILVTTPGTYTLNVSRNDCSTIDHVIVAKDCYTDVPNAFTPNGDGENDYFYPRQLLSQGVKTFSMKIFNRWGQQVFMTENTSGRGWDGKFNDEEQAMGVYVYQIDVVYDNGRPEQYTGNVTLIR